MEPAYAAGFLPVVDAWLRGERLAPLPMAERDILPAVALGQGAFVLSEYGQAVPPEDAPDGSVALMHICGTITKHDQGCGPAGMETKADLLRRCYANDRIRAVVLVIESGGGEVGAVRIMDEAIAGRNKPVGAFIDDYAYSAAYGIATACDLVVAGSTLARTGSIGTYLTIADYSERYKQMGIKLTDIYASASTDKNREYLEALGGNPEPLRRMVDVYNEHVLATVERNRAGKLAAGREVWGTGREWFAPEAVELGLIDGIDTLDNFINYFNV